MFQRLHTILIVEDAPDVRALFVRLVRGKIERVLLAEDGLAAREILEQERVDILVTDFRMPRMDGVELLEWCRARGQYMPVIFTSADGRRFAREEIALGDCCATMLDKPIDIEVFYIALEAAEAHEHHRDCVHQPYKEAIRARLES